MQSQVAGRMWGESNPIVSAPVATTRTSALKLVSGDTIPGADQPVLVTRLTGNFQKSGKGPTRNATVSGKTMYVIVSQATGEVLDISVSPSAKAIDLAG